MIAQAEKRSVAVLVIDDFWDMAADGEKRLRRFMCSHSQPEEYCIVRPDGQTFGTRGVSEGTSSTPHGDLVYGELYNALKGELNGQDSTKTWYGYRALAKNWIRQVDEWDVDGKKLLLVAVDTEGFKTRVISEHIEEALDLFREKMGIERFVLNMSFAIIPCSTAALYEQMLDTEIEIQALEDTLNECVEGDTSRPSEDVEELKSLVKPENVRKLRSVIKSGEAPRDSYTDLPLSAAAADLADDLIKKLLVPAVYHKHTIKPRATWIQWLLNSDLLVCLLEKLNVKPRVTWDPPHLDKDPLICWLGRLNMTKPDRKPPLVIPVAAAGNLGEVNIFRHVRSPAAFPFPLAPAKFDSVVSVGALDKETAQKLADRSGRKPEAGLLGKISATFRGSFWSRTEKKKKNDYSNPCEITMSGKSTTSDEFGTSFAAPKFSAKAAMYLLRGGEIPYPEGTTTKSGAPRPPLGYADDYGPWDNMTYEEAKNRYASGNPCWP